MRKTAAWLTFLVLAAGCPVGAESEPDSSVSGFRELIEQIVELQRQIDELTAQLPPEALAELQVRLAESARSAESTPAEPPLAEAPSPPPPTEPTVVAAEVENVAGETRSEEPPPQSPPPAPSPTAEPQVAEVKSPPPPLPPAEQPGPLPLLQRRQPRATCNTLDLLDENADGKISSQDRYWRHLYLWNDKNHDGQVQEREVESVYDRGVREIATTLETFIRAKGSLGETRLEEHVVLDLKGDGFSDRSRRDDGVLMVDASAIQRGAGPTLLGPAQNVLEGLQPFRAGQSFRDPAGHRVTLTCP